MMIFKIRRYRTFTHWLIASVFLLTLSCSGASKVVPVVVDRSALPGPSEASQWSPPDVQTFKLATGQSLWFVHDASAPLVSVRIVSPLDVLPAIAHKEGIVSLAVDYLDEGTENYTALELDEAWKDLATDFFGQVDDDNIFLGFDALARNFDASLGLLAEVMRKPSLDPEEFERLKKRRIASLVAAEDNPDHGRRVLTRRVLSAAGGFRYGVLPNGTRASIEDLIFKDVRACARALPESWRRSLVVVTGNVRPEHVAGALATLFEGLPVLENGAGGTALGGRQPTKPGTAHFIDYPKAPQTGISVVRVVKSEPENYFAETVFARIFGSAFTSRLNLNLREDKGYTYGARGDYKRFGTQALFGLQARVKADTTAASVQEMFKELKDITADRPITEEEFAAAKSGLMLGFADRFQSASMLSNQLVNAAALGRGSGWYAQWQARLRKVSLEDVRTVAAQISKPEGYKIVLVGDKTLLKDQLKEFVLIEHDKEGQAL